MKVGTRSFLFGAHQFLIHPLFVGLAWWRLYGFPFDPRLWFAFFLHDIGYVGKVNIDGPEGKTHVEVGAAVMQLLFGKKWGDFVRYHSRSYAEKDGAPISRLCVADKFAFCITPARLYLPMVCATGEIEEYMDLPNSPLAIVDQAHLKARTPKAWHAAACSVSRRWVEEHKDLTPQTC